MNARTLLSASRVNEFATCSKHQCNRPTSPLQNAATAITDKRPNHQTTGPSPASGLFTGVIKPIRHSSPLHIEASVLGTCLRVADRPSPSPSPPPPPVDSRPRGCAPVLPGPSNQSAGRHPAANCRPISQDGPRSPRAQVAGRQGAAPVANGPLRSGARVLQIDLEAGCCW